MSQQYNEYSFSSSEHAGSSVHLLTPVFDFAGPLRQDTRILDIGCGNGFIAGKFIAKGCQVVGIDLSTQGIALARKVYPTGRFEVLAADDKVLSNLNEKPFDIVISTEVIEHLYSPREYIRGCFTALRPGGRFICSTPYHGYLKNFAIGLLGKWDSHANPLWDCGHIKLWSRKTLGVLLAEAGFTNLQFRGTGRIPFLWKSMVMCGEKNF